MASRSPTASKRDRFGPHHVAQSSSIRTCSFAAFAESWPLDVPAWQRRLFVRENFSRQLARSHFARRRVAQRSAATARTTAPRRRYLVASVHRHPCRLGPLPADDFAAGSRAARPSSFARSSAGIFFGNSLRFSALLHSRARAACLRLAIGPDRASARRRRLRVSARRRVQCARNVSDPIIRSRKNRLPPKT